MPGSVERRADAYSNFILGRISQENYEDTGDQAYADQAIAFYKKALTLDPGSVDIRLKMAETYAEAQRLRDAVDTAQGILKDHPDELATHRLLARIYVRSLGHLGAGAHRAEPGQRFLPQVKGVHGDAGMGLAVGGKERRSQRQRLRRRAAGARPCRARSGRADGPLRRSRRRDAGRRTASRAGR